MLKRSKRLIGKAQRNKKMFQRMGFKYGIRVPVSMEHALKLDEQNGNNLWAKALAKEKAKVQVAMKFLKKGERAPPSYKK